MITHNILVYFCKEFQIICVRILHTIQLQNWECHSN